MDAFVLPSLYEGLPVVGVEAQTAGLPCFFSTDMTKETKVLDSTKFIELSKSPKEWADIIIKELKLFQRKDTSKEITDNNFNIKNESKKMLKTYINEKENNNE